jgi:hypothetical protein
MSCIRASLRAKVVALISPDDVIVTLNLDKAVTAGGSPVGRVRGLPGRRPESALAQVDSPVMPQSHGRACIPIGLTPDRSSFLAAARCHAPADRAPSAVSWKKPALVVWGRRRLLRLRNVCRSAHIFGDANQVSPSPDSAFRYRSPRPFSAFARAVFYKIGSATREVPFLPMRWAERMCYGKPKGSPLPGDGLP